MIKRLGLLFFGLMLALGLVIVGGCTVTTSSSDPASPPSGTTSITVGSGGTAALTAGSDSGSASIIVLSKSSISDSGTPVTSTSNLNVQNITVQIWSSTTSTQSATVSSITYAGGSSGDPISYALTLDRSGSMSTADNASMETAATTFISNSGSSDQGAVINFGSNVRVDQALTTDKALLTYAATMPGSTGVMTALYDSMGTAVTTAAAGSNSRKAAIAMTDGGENASSTYTSTNAVISHANNNNVPIYCVGLGLTSGSAAELALQAIASGTGGIYYYAPTYAELLALYNSISSALSSSWTVNFTSPITITTSTTYYILVTVTYSGGITSSVLFTVTV